MPEAAEAGTDLSLRAEGSLKVIFQALFTWDGKTKTRKADLALVDFALGDAPAQEKALFCGEEEMSFYSLWPGTRRELGVKGGCPLLAGLALGVEGAEGAFGGGGGAGAGAEVHEGLVDDPGGLFSEHGLNEGLDLVAAGFFAGGFLESQEPGDDTFRIAVDGRKGAVKGKGVDRALGIGTNSGEGGEVLGILWDLPSMLADQPLRRLPKLADPAVVTQSFPGAQEAVIICGGKGLGAGKTREEGPPALPHHLDPGLLEHDLADPDSVRIKGPPPWEIPLPSLKPVCKEPCADLCRAFHRSGFG